MTKTEIVKLVAGSMASIGAGAIAAAYCTNAPYSRNFNTLMKACVWLGGLAVQGMVGQKAQDYIDNFVDNAVAAYAEFKETAKNIEMQSKDEIIVEEGDEIDGGER